MMFSVRKRLLRFVLVSRGRSSFVRLPCSSDLYCRRAFGTVLPCSYGIQVPFIFLLPHVRQATSVCAEASSLKCEDASESKEGIALQIAHIVNEKAEWLPTENELQRFLPLSIPAVLSVLKEPMPLEHALRFLSWACKQPGFTLCTDDVNEIGHLWASKYASFTLTDLEECLNSEGAMYTEATWATLATTSNFLNKAEQCVRIFMKSQKHGCVHSQLLYDPFLFALMRCQRFDTALLTLQEMLNAKILPGERVLGPCFDALCNAGKSKDVYKLVQDMGRSSSASFRNYAYSRLITAVWRTAQSSMALDLLKEMKREGFQPDRQAYTACLKLLCKRQRYELARSLLKDMSEHGFAPDMSTYTALVNGLYKAGKAKEALEVIEKLRKEGRPLDNKILIASLSCLFAVERVEDAFTEFEEMQRGSDSEDPVLYFVMIRNLCKIGYINRAFELKKTMTEKGFKADARLYETLQRTLCDGSCYVDELLLLVQELKSNGFSPTAESYLTLVTHFCSRGDLKTAREWAVEMVSEGHKPTPYIRTRFPELQDVFKEG